MKFYISVFFILFNLNTNCLSLRESHQLSKEILKKAKDGYFSDLNDYVEKGADLDYQDKDGKTILIYAVHYHRGDIVRYLLGKNVDPNILDSRNLSALMHASKSLEIKIVSELLKFKRLNINQQGRYGKTALDFVYDPKRFSAEQIKSFVKFNDLSKVQRDLIILLRKKDAKTANELKL